MQLVMMRWWIRMTKVFSSFSHTCPYISSSNEWLIVAECLRTISFCSQYHSFIVEYSKSSSGEGITSMIWLTMIPFAAIGNSLPGSNVILLEFLIVFLDTKRFSFFLPSLYLSFIQRNCMLCYWYINHLCTKVLWNIFNINLRQRSEFQGYNLLLYCLMGSIVNLQNFPIMIFVNPHLPYMLLFISFP